MNFVGMKNNKFVFWLSPLTYVGNGHSEGLIDLSSVFQTVYINLRSTRSDLKRIVMLLFLFLGKK